MTMRVIEGFDYLPSSGISTVVALSGWTSYFRNPTRVTGRFGYGYGGNFSSSGSSSAGFFGILKYIGVNAEDGFIGCAVQRTSGDIDSAGPCIAFVDITNNVIQLVVSFENYGIVRVKRGNSGFSGVTTIAASDPGTFYDETWFNAEVYAKIGNTTGEVEVRIDGKTVLHIIDEDTQHPSGGAYFSGCAMGISGSGSWSGSFDDFACWDTEGTSNNTWLGTNRIKTQAVIADGTNIDSTIGGSAPAATHWQSLLMNKALDDTKYVYIPNTNVGDYDLYDMDPVVSAPIVHAVQVRVGARQDDATQLTMKTLIESGGTTVEGPEEALSQTYNFYYQIAEVDPDTGVGWTQAGANGIQVGYKLESSD